jgi:hypothetical protein
VFAPGVIRLVLDCAEWLDTRRVDTLHGADKVELVLEG